MASAQALINFMCLDIYEALQTDTPLNELLNADNY